MAKKEEGLVRSVVGLIGDVVEGSVRLTHDTIFEGGTKLLHQAVYELFGLGAFILGDIDFQRDTHKEIEGRIRELSNLYHLPQRIYAMTWGQIVIPKQAKRFIVKTAKYTAVATMTGPFIVVKLVAPTLFLPVASLWCRTMSHALILVFPGCEFGGEIKDKAAAEKKAA